jgi:hypothetical protein
MELLYSKYADYVTAIERAKMLVAQKFALVEATLAAAKLSGELISDELWAEYCTWQLLSAMVRTQELMYDSEDLLKQDLEDDEDYDD